jgi:hypothetical protein
LWRFLSSSKAARTTTITPIALATAYIIPEEIGAGDWVGCVEADGEVGGGEDVAGGDVAEVVTVSY